MRSGDIRPWEGDISPAVPDDKASSWGELGPDRGGSKIWRFIIGSGDRIPFEDDMDVDFGLLNWRTDPPLMESLLEGEAERMLSEAGLPCLSGSAVDSLDIPGKRILPIVDMMPDVSSWFRRYAADP